MYAQWIYLILILSKKNLTEIPCLTSPSSSSLTLSEQWPDLHYGNAIYLSLSLFLPQLQLDYMRVTYFFSRKKTNQYWMMLFALIEYRNVHLSIYSTNYRLSFDYTYAQIYVMVCCYLIIGFIITIFFGRK